ncbi:MAG: hypothetical protein ACLP70_13475 [Streptosporangiaceae bacterium]
MSWPPRTILEFRLGAPGTVVAGVALVAVGLLLIIATQWDSLGEGSQRCRMTG